MEHRNRLLQRIQTLDNSFKRLIILTFLIFIIMALLRPNFFLTSRNIISMAFQFPEMGILSLAIAIAFISGGMDLSLVGISNLSGILGGYLMIALTKGEYGSFGNISSIVISLLVTLLVGAICGYFNGYLISSLKVIPILATLGTMQLFTGIALIITKGSAVIGFPEEFSFVGQGKVLGVPVPLALFAIVAFLLHVVLSKTETGYNCYFLGANEKAARFAGISIKKSIIKTYVISGILASIAGILMMSRVNSAKADFGSSYTMQTILIAVLGGVSPLGGKGKVSGVVIAVLALQFLSSGFGMLRLSLYAKEFVWGILLVSLVALNILWDERKST